MADCKAGEGNIQVSLEHLIMQKSKELPKNKQITDGSTSKYRNQTKELSMAKVEQFEK